MSALFRWFTLRSFRGHFGRAALAIAGVALGVGVFVGIRLASRSALDSFSNSVDTVAGRAELLVRSDSQGFDERLFLSIRRVRGVSAAAPVVEAQALTVDASGTYDRERSLVMTLIGIDPLLEAPFVRLDAGTAGGASPDFRAGALGQLADPRAVAITSDFARRHHFQAGDSLRLLVSGVVQALCVRRVLDAPQLQRAWGGQLAILDIATAQEVLGRVGRIDRVDLRVENGDVERARRALEAVLPAGLRVERPAARTRQVENMVRAFDLNLTALSFIALFVATFLVFDAVAGTALRRRPEAAVLRALGSTRGVVRGLFAAEGLIVGAIGSVAGLGLGVGLARAAAPAVSRSLSDLYAVRAPGPVTPDAGVLVTGLLLGISLSLLASLVPAEEAARASPALAAREGVRPRWPRRTLLIASGLGVFLLALAALASFSASAGHRPIDGFASAFFVLAGFAALVPAATLGIERALRAPLRFAGVEALLATRSLEDSVGRTAPVVGALMVAVAMVVAMAVMVGSFRRTVDVWIGQSIRGDLFVEPAGLRFNAGTTHLPVWLPDSLARVPGVLAVDSYRGRQIVLGNRPAFVGGVELAVQRDRGRLLFRRGESARIVERARVSGGVLVSESFAHHHALLEGGRLTLDTPSSRVALPVEGVFYDYSTDAGIALMDRTRYEALWKDRRCESLALYLAPGTDAEATGAAVRAAAGEMLLRVTPNRELREQVLVVFDRTFRVTGALQWIAALVAVLGVFHSLTALVVERSSEIAMLRAAGALRAQIRRMVLAESVLLGTVAALLGIACGVVLSLILIHVINVQFFGWTIRTTWSAGVFAGAFALVLASSLAAGWLPARLAAARSPAEGLREE